MRLLSFASLSCRRPQSHHRSEIVNTPNVDFPDLHVKQVRGVLITDTGDVYSNGSSTKGRFGAVSSEESQNWAGLFVR